jgi:transcriptional regulator with XRE-family HTH domain
LSIGKVLAECRYERELTQEQLSLNLPVSKEMLGKIELDKRKLQKDVMPFVASELDHVKATTALWGEVADGVTIPYLDGDYIDHTPAALIARANREIDEAKRNLAEVEATKPIGFMNMEEVNTLRNANKELLDICAVAITLVGDNCEWHGLSFSDEIKQWQTTLKARRLIQK